MQKNRRALKVALRTKRAGRMCITSILIKLGALTRTPEGSGKYRNVPDENRRGINHRHAQGPGIHQPNPPNKQQKVLPKAASKWCKSRGMGRRPMHLSELAERIRPGVSCT